MSQSETLEKNLVGAEMAESDNKATEVGKDRVYGAGRKVLDDPYFSSLNKSTMYYNNNLVASKYNFRRFDIAKDLKDRRNFSMTITAKRCTGKSVLLKDLCHKIKGWYDDVHIWSSTASLQPDLFNYVKEDNLHAQFDEEDFLKIYNRQKDNILKLMQKQSDKKKLPHILLIFDDMITDRTVMTSKAISSLFTLGRHSNIAIIFITQNFVSIPKLWRTNVDVAISFFLDNEKDRANFIDSYLSTRNRGIGRCIFDNVTKEEHNCIVCMNNLTSQNPEDLVRTYKASMNIPNFKMSQKNIERALVKNSNYRPTGNGGEFMPRIKAGGIQLG